VIVVSPHDTTEFEPLQPAPDALIAFLEKL
jgi:hypothetical protein